MPRRNAFSKSLLTRLLVLLFFSAASTAYATATPRLPHLFSDHMVLQRDQDISVWGWADPSEKITVTLASASRGTTASADGTWKISLPPMPAGGPFTLSVKGNSTVTFADVLLGEVWVASGQSNMTYALSRSSNAAEEIASADYSQIRLFMVPKDVSLTPKADTLPANWEICSPDSTKGFSAVAYYFARDLYKSLNIPVGIIQSAWSGSRGEEWLDHDSLARDPELQPILKRWQDSPQDVQSFGAAGSPVSLMFDDFEFLPKDAAAPPVKFADFEDGSSATATGGSWTYNWSSARDLRFELTASDHRNNGYSAWIHGHADGATDSRLQGLFSPTGASSDMTAYQGIRFWMRGQGSFQFQLLQPTIYDWDFYTTENIQGAPNWKQVTVLFKDLKQSGWGVVNDLTLNSLNGIQLISMPTVGEPDRPPSGLYGAMIAPLLNYHVRGAIWYQGEGNTWRAIQYRKLLPALIANWRTGWQEPTLAFGIVQLPNHGASPEFGDSIWAEMREAQLLTAKKVSGAGLAVTIDVGSAQNLHPPNKKPVGERLALWALGTVYAKKIVYSGPRYENFHVDGSHVRLEFQLFGSALSAQGGELRGFTIAGSDHQFHNAQAHIDGDTVVVESAEVRSPVSVRYDWSSSPTGNLYNQENLPASPFRTDDWPVASTGKQ